MDNLTLGERIKEARLEKQLTQKEVSGDFITRNMLSQIENGLAKPSIKTIEYIAKKLDKPLTYFMDAMVEEDLYNNNQISRLDNLIDCYIKKEWDNCIEGLDKIINNLDSKKAPLDIREIHLLMHRCLAYKGFELFNDNMLEDAEECLKKSLSYQQKIPYTDIYLKSKILLCLTHLSLKFDKLEDAEEYFSQYKQISEMKELSSQSLLVEGGLLLIKKRYKDCTELLEKNNGIDNLNSFNYYFLLGRAYFEQEKYSETIDFFTKCYEYIDKSNDKRLASLHKYIAESYSKLGDFEKAYEFMRKVL